MTPDVDDNGRAGRLAFADDAAVMLHGDLDQQDIVVAQIHEEEREIKQITDDETLPGEEGLVDLSAEGEIVDLSTEGETNSTPEHKQEDRKTEFEGFDTECPPDDIVDTVDHPDLFGVEDISTDQSQLLLNENDGIVDAVLVDVDQSPLVSIADNDPADDAQGVISGIDENYEDLPAKVQDDQQIEGDTVDENSNGALSPTKEHSQDISFSVDDNILAYDDKTAQHTVDCDTPGVDCDTPGADNINADEADVAAIVAFQHIDNNNIDEMLLNNQKIVGGDVDKRETSVEDLPETLNNESTIEYEVVDKPDERIVEGCAIDEDKNDENISVEGTELISDQNENKFNYEQESQHIVDKENISEQERSPCSPEAGSMVAHCDSVHIGSGRMSLHDFEGEGECDLDVFEEQQTPSYETANIFDPPTPFTEEVQGGNEQWKDGVVMDTEEKKNERLEGVNTEASLIVSESSGTILMGEFNNNRDGESDDESEDEEPESPNTHVTGQSFVYPSAVNSMQQDVEENNGIVNGTNLDNTFDHKSKLIDDSVNSFSQVKQFDSNSPADNFQIQGGGDQIATVHFNQENDYQ